MNIVVDGVSDPSPSLLFFFFFSFFGPNFTVGQAAWLDSCITSWQSVFALSLSLSPSEASQLDLYNISDI